MKKEKLSGSDGFEIYYSSMFGERWPILKASLLKESKAVAYDKNNLDVDKYMFFVADQPLLKKETILKIIEESSSNKITVPKSNNTMYNPVIFPNKYNSELLSLEGDKGGKQIILKNLDDITFVDIEDAYEFQDVDVIEEYLKLINERKL